jgi:hypothetical protein
MSNSILGGKRILAVDDEPDYGGITPNTELTFEQCVCYDFGMFGV